MELASSVLIKLYMQELISYERAGTVASVVRPDMAVAFRLFRLLLLACVEEAEISLVISRI